MINSIIKCTVCLTEIHVMENNKGNEKDRENPARGGSHEYCNFKKSKSVKNLRKYS